MPDQRSSSLKSYQQTPRSHTTSVTLTGSDANRTHTNLNATGSITLTLPRATPNSTQFVNGSGLEFRFMCVNTNSLVIQPVSTDTIRGNALGASQTITGAGTGLWLVCAVPGYWDIVNSGGGGGGGNTPYNVSPSTHTATPAFPADDYFEGAVLDTTGSRFSGATAWSWLNQGSTTASLGSGLITLKAPIQTSFNYNLTGIIQPLVAGNVSYFTLVEDLQFNNGASNYNDFGMILYESGTGKAVNFYMFNYASSIGMGVDSWGPSTGHAGTIASNNTGFAQNQQGQINSGYWGLFRPVYYQITITGGTIYFNYSLTGAPNTYINYTSITTATYFTTAPNYIGFGMDTIQSQTVGFGPGMIVDTFARTA